MNFYLLCKLSRLSKDMAQANDLNVKKVVMQAFSSGVIVSSFTLCLNKNSQYYVTFTNPDEKSGKVDVTLYHSSSPSTAVQTFKGYTFNDWTKFLSKMAIQDKERALFTRFFAVNDHQTQMFALATDRNGTLMQAYGYVDIHSKDSMESAWTEPLFAVPVCESCWWLMFHALL
jgi:hypothetical protein